MPFKGDMIVICEERKSLPRKGSESGIRWNSLWRCSGFVPSSRYHGIICNHRGRERLQHSLPYLRYLPPLLWLLLFLFGQWSKLFQYFLIKYTQFPLLPLGQPSNWPAFFLICMSWTRSWMSKVLTNAEQSAHHSRLLSLMHAMVVSVFFARAYCCLPVTYDPS